MGLRIENITKKFGDFLAVDNVSLEIGQGELGALLGPSGSGKTTLLRIIAGLEESDSGEVYLSGESVQNKQIKERNIGFVFQHYALFRHMTVEDNIAFGLKMKGASKKEISTRVNELLDLIQIPRLAKRYPSELSGGQKQRVALARALAARPKILLLDEPFGALDANVRRDLRKWLKNLHKEIQVTSVMVTHDQEEAFEVSDKVAIMHQGKLQQVGSPDYVFHNPANGFVMRFLGNVNIFHGRVESGVAYTDDLKVNYNGNNSDGKASVYVRPHELDISLNRVDENSIESIITHLNAAGSIVKLDLKSSAGQDLQVDIGYEQYTELGLAVGKKVFVNPKFVRVFVEDYSI